MNLYFDMEFTGLHQNTTLISLGVVSDEKHYFYAEFTDYNKDQVNDWIRENVIANLKYKDLPANSLDQGIYEVSRHKNNPVGEDIYKGYSINIAGDKAYIAKEFKKWIQQFGNESLQFVSDVCHYDFVLLCELFGGALEMPHNVCPFCVDINQMLGDLYTEDYAYAFDINREEFINFSPANKHNAKHDAIVIRKCYKKIKKILKGEIK